jgi:hypothetical protein
METAPRLIPIRARIPDGGQTRVIDLPGERRIIRSLDLVRKGQLEKAPQSELVRAKRLIQVEGGPL